MPPVNEAYVVDENGARVGVILPIEDYQKLLEALEELETIRAYDAAKHSGDEAIPLEQAVREIERVAGELQGHNPAPRPKRTGRITD